MQETEKIHIFAHNESLIYYKMFFKLLLHSICVLIKPIKLRFFFSLKLAHL